MLNFSFVRLSLLLFFWWLQNDQWSEMNDMHIKQNRSICTLICKKPDVSTVRIYKNIKVQFMAFLWGHPVWPCTIQYTFGCLQIFHVLPSAVMFGYSTFYVHVLYVGSRFDFVENLLKLQIFCFPRLATRHQVWSSRRRSTSGVKSGDPIHPSWAA